MNSAKLDVLIASYGPEGLERLAAIGLPKISGVRWLISSQFPEGNFPEIPPQLVRDDILVEFSTSVGLSVNRNLLLDRAGAELCLLADDDLVYSPKGIESIIRTFDLHPDLDIAAFMYNTVPDVCRSDPGKVSDFIPLTEKQYPSSEFPLNNPPKGFYITTFELAFRLQSVRRSGIRFNENFGVKALYPCGEDSLFLDDSMRAGLRGRFFPITIITHLGASTGIRRLGDADILRAQGLLIPRLAPKPWLPRVLLKAWRSSRATNRPLLFCLRHTLNGWWRYYRDHHTLFPG